MTKAAAWVGAGAFTFKITPDYVWTALAAILFLVIVISDYRN